MIKKETKKEIELEQIPFVGGLFKGIEKLVDLAERVEQAGGEIKKTGEILGEKGRAKGVYGFSIRTGIAGQPRIQTFGNIRPAEKNKGKKEIKLSETAEPMIDVFDEKDHILIIAELPGVTKKSIILKRRGDILILKAGNEKRKYEKEILLPAKLEFEKKEMNFKNGILELKILKK